MFTDSEFHDQLKALFDERSEREAEELMVALEAYAQVLEVLERSEPPSELSAQYHRLALHKAQVQCWFLDQVFNKAESNPYPIAFVGWAGDKRPSNQPGIAELAGVSAADDHDPWTEMGRVSSAKESTDSVAEALDRLTKLSSVIDPVQTVAFASHGLPHIADHIQIHLGSIATVPQAEDWAVISSDEEARLHMLSPDGVPHAHYLMDFNEYLDSVQRARGPQAPEQTFTIVPDAAHNDMKFAEIALIMRTALRDSGRRAEVDLSRVPKHETRSWGEGMRSLAGLDPKRSSWKVWSQGRSGRTRS
ncbi:MAG: hypothetical protein HOQ05_11565 [Corynebacteriales bacterium]|nr:hypothetical protein [Mycobacteriales bacterium]